MPLENRERLSTLMTFGDLLKDIRVLRGHYKREEAENYSGIPSSVFRIIELQMVHKLSKVLRDKDTVNALIDYCTLDYKLMKKIIRKMYTPRMEQKLNN